MTTYSWLVVGLAAVDVFILTILYLCLRSSKSVDRRILFPVAAGLVGFVFHAFVFFSGAFLYLQLATLASVFGLCYFSAFRRDGEKKTGI
jgi:hypothetical protein